MNTCRLLSPIALLVTALFIPSASLASEFPVYEMSVTLDADQSSMQVRGEIRIPASDLPRSEIVLGLGEVLTDLELEASEPEFAGEISVERDELIAGYAEGWGTYPYVLSFPSPIPAGQSVVLSFSCRGEEATAFVYHLGSPVTFASGINTAWYPQVEDARVDDKGWTGLRSIGTVSFHLPPDLSVYAAGRVAGSGADANRFIFDFPVYFAFSAGSYQVRETSGEPSIAAYFLRPRDNEGDYVDGSAAVLEVLESTFGDYPHSRFAVVEVPTADADKAGFAGASLDGFILATSSFLDRPFNTAYFGHEIGHQWWGNLMTTTETRGSMMFSEGMAQFGSLVSVEEIDGPEAAERYRRIGYPGYIYLQSGLGYLTLAAAGLDLPIPEANEGAAARIIADGKGFQVWNMLADQVGPTRFSDALKRLVGRYSLEPVAWDDFLRGLEQNLGEDLGWFYDQWFERPGAPEPTLQWSQEGDRIAVVVTQAAPTFRMKMEVEVEDSEGRRQVHLVDVSGATTAVEFEASGPTQSVTLDPKFRILRWTPEYRAEAQALATPFAARLKHWSGEPEEALKALEAARAEFDSEAGSDPFGRLFAIESLIGRILTHQEKLEDAQRHLETALRAPIRSVDELPWAYYLLGKVALGLGDDSLLQEAQRSIATADTLASGTGAPEALQDEIRRASQSD